MIGGRGFIKGNVKRKGLWTSTPCQAWTSLLVTSFNPQQEVDGVILCCQPDNDAESDKSLFVGLRIAILHFPGGLIMQGTWVWCLVQEDSTCHEAAKPMYHNYWAWALEPLKRSLQWEASAPQPDGNPTRHN